jgi:hypothetical protein
MQAHIIIDGHPATLTDERAESSYGQPVLVIEGAAYGPGDILPSGRRACDCIAQLDLRAKHDDIEGAAKLHAIWLTLCDQLSSPGRDSYTIMASQRSQSSLALVIPKEIVDREGIRPGDPFRATCRIAGGKLIIEYTRLS